MAATSRQRSRKRARPSPAREGRSHGSARQRERRHVREAPRGSTPKPARLGQRVHRSPTRERLGAEPKAEAAASIAGRGSKGRESPPRQPPSGARATEVSKRAWRRGNRQKRLQRRDDYVGLAMARAEIKASHPTVKGRNAQYKLARFVTQVANSQRVKDLASAVSHPSAERAPARDRGQAKTCLLYTSPSPRDPE